MTDHAGRGTDPGTGGRLLVVGFAALGSLSHARRHFDLVLSATEGSGPWTAKGPPPVDGTLGKADPESRRWRHHGADAHLHVVGPTARGTALVNVELYSRETGRPSPIAVSLEPGYLADLSDPARLLRDVAILLGETEDRLLLGEDMTPLDSWSRAVQAHLEGRGSPAVATIDFADAGLPLRVLDAQRREIRHDDLAALGDVVPHARLVQNLGMDLVVSRVRRIMVDGIPPIDPMATLRATALAAEAANRWNGGSRA